MRVLVRLPALAAAAIVAASIVAGPGARPAGAADACSRALEYEKAAATDKASAQARYDSAVAGLAANASCGDAQMHLVNEGYLLSMRAPAEHDLHIGNWQRDLDRANMLLTQCTNWPGLRGTAAGTNCAAQIRYNGIIAKNLTSQPTPAPAASNAPGAAPGASPAPATSAAPAPRLGPAMPPPAPPQPSPSPVPAH